MKIVCSNYRSAAKGALHSLSVLSLVSGFIFAVWHLPGKAGWDYCCRKMQVVILMISAVKWEWAGFMLCPGHTLRLVPFFENTAF